MELIFSCCSDEVGWGMRRGDPVAHMDLAGIEAAERKARKAHPILFRVAEFIPFVRDPVRWIRARIVLRRAGYRRNLAGGGELLGSLNGSRGRDGQ